MTDNGAGISADFLPHVFESFRQSEAGPARAHGGLGIGLSIAKHIVELHGGSIEARSPGPGEGATFVVRLPISPLVSTTLGVSRVPATKAGRSRATAPERARWASAFSSWTTSRTPVNSSPYVLEKSGMEVRAAGSAPRR